MKAYVAGYTHRSSGGFYGKGGVPQKAALLLLFNKKKKAQIVFERSQRGEKQAEVSGFPKSHVLFAVRLRHCSPLSNLHAIHRNIYSWAMVSLLEVPMEVLGMFFGFINYRNNATVLE